MKLDSLLVTRGRDGMALFESPVRLTHIPIHGSNQAVDVTGAGDTVLAAYTLALATGASPLEAAHIANIAGGLVVMKRGTATVSRRGIAAGDSRRSVGSERLNSCELHRQKFYPARNCAKRSRSENAEDRASCSRMGASTRCTSGMCVTSKVLAVKGICWLWQ